jgi:LAO/AO transport system kinase
VSEVAKKVLDGDIRAVARLISDIDNNVPDVIQTLKELYPHTGRAYVVGITGAPGVGKSTLVDQILDHLRKERKTVGIIAVDPTSPFSGGAILGDRVRMQRHSNDDGVFIRSLATRGHFGGLTLSTRAAIDVLDAMGKDYILVETVGVGQDEVEVAKMAHTTVIVVIPGMGDEIQAIKAGILEAGDIFVINKSDREGSDKTYTDLRLLMETGKYGDVERAWTVPILKTEAIVDKGTTELLNEVERHRMFLMDSVGGVNPRRSRDRVKEELEEMVKGRLIQETVHLITASGEFDKAVESIVKGNTDPYTETERLILPKLGLTDR